MTARARTRLRWPPDFGNGGRVKEPAPAFAGWGVVAEKQVYPDPSKVEAKDGAVEVDGPDAVDVAMTPEAAEETAERLSDEAVVARGQRRLENIPHKPGDRGS